MADVKRFYKEAAVATSDANLFCIQLDGKPIKTKSRVVLEVAPRLLAVAIADEWQAQDEKVDYALMPMTRLAMSTQDHVMQRMDETRAEALKFAQTDLVCYRATDPEKLARRQAALWQPPLDRVEAEYGSRLVVVSGVMPIQQPKEAISALARQFDTYDPGELQVAHGLTHKFGSIILALNVMGGYVTALEAFTMARLDEEFQAELWGRDDEADKRAAATAQEVAEFERYLKLLGS